MKIGGLATRWAFGLVAVFAATTCGCENEDAARLARVGHKVAAKAQALTAEADEKLARGWQAVRSEWDDPALDARVAMRLRWDKSLAETALQCSASHGVVELKGTVSNLEQRRRAVELAESTAGVDKVTDSIVVTTTEP